jgi:hypothetical protein
VIERDRWDERAGLLSAAVSSLVRLAHSGFGSSGETGDSPRDSWIERDREGQPE